MQPRPLLPSTIPESTRVFYRNNINSNNNNENNNNNNNNNNDDDDDDDDDDDYGFPQLFIGTQPPSGPELGLERSLVLSFSSETFPYPEWPAVFWLRFAQFGLVPELIRPGCFISSFGDGVLWLSILLLTKWCPASGFFTLPW